jgi:hypothetical protein
MKLAVLLLVCAAAHGATLRYWVQTCSKPETGCRDSDADLAQWAMQAWERASAGALTLEKTPDQRRAHIRLYWATAEQGLYGEARPIIVDGVRGAEVFVRPTEIRASRGSPLLRDAVVYLTCLHETGHALGLPHTAAFADIMYSFQFGGDIPEYFGRYVRQLSSRDDIRRSSGLSPGDCKRLIEIYK